MSSAVTKSQFSRSAIAANHSNAFWSLFGVYAAGDIIPSSDPTAMPDSVRVDGLALSHVYAAFGSRNDATSQGYSPAFDSDLDGDVDGIDLGRLYLNFGAIWKF